MNNPHIAKIAPTTQQIRDAYKAHMAQPNEKNDTTRGRVARALGGFLIAEAWGVKFEPQPQERPRNILNASHDIPIHYLRLPLSMVCQAHIEDGKLCDFFIFIDPKDQQELWDSVDRCAPTIPEDYAVSRALSHIRAQAKFPWRGLFECASEELAEIAAGIASRQDWPFLGVLCSLYPATRQAKSLALNINHDEHPEEPQP